MFTLLDNLAAHAEAISNPHNIETTSRPAPVDLNYCSKSLFLNVLVRGVAKALERRKLSLSHFPKLLRKHEDINLKEPTPTFRNTWPILGDEALSRDEFVVTNVQVLTQHCNLAVSDSCTGSSLYVFIEETLSTHTL